MAKKKSEQKEEVSSGPLRLTDQKDEEEQAAVEAKSKPEEKSE